MVRPVDGLLRTISDGDTRSIHFVDIENLVGSGVINHWQVQSMCGKYVSKTNATINDLFFIAAGPQNRQATVEGWSWGHTFYQFRKGKDGADHALVDFFSSIERVAMFEQIYIASGDHGLKEIATKAHSCGIPVTVVTGKGKQSHVFFRFPHLAIGSP
jgi:hypothetical protein